MRWDRRDFLLGSLTILGSTATRGGSVQTVRDVAVPEFEFEEATISDLQIQMQSGKLTARALAQAYLDRIESWTAVPVGAAQDAAPLWQQVFAQPPWAPKPTGRSSIRQVSNGVVGLKP